MVETKGVRFLVDLWRRPEMKEQRLIMAGKGPLAEELRGSSPPNVRWVGHVEGEEKQKWINGCRAILFPCLWPEPLSTVAYEAYERGRPILASDLGGMKEIIRDGETGRLLAPGNAAVWSEAVRGLDAAASLRLGRNGRKWLEDHVSSAAWNREFDQIAERVLSTSESRTVSAAARR
jgi:glycosyltransferase involved in cell wall biosynthesis